MKAKKAKAASRKATPRVAAGELPGAYYRVHALWVATRAVSQHEDELCTLMHEIKRSGELSDAVRAELQSLMESIPAAEFMRDAEALETELARTRAGKRKAVTRGERR